MTVTADVATEVPDLAGYRDAWEALFRTRPHEPSVSLEWTEAMLRHHLAPGDRFFLLRVRRGGDVSCLVPLVAQASVTLGQRVVTLFPISEIYDTHSDVLAADLDEATLEQLLSAIFGLPLRWDMFRLGRLLTDQRLLPALEAVLTRRRARYRLRDERGSFSVALPGSFDDYLSERSAKFRNYLRRIEKKLVGTTGVKVVDVTHEREFDAAYAQVLAVERNSWKHGHGTSISAVPRQVSFYEEMCRGALVQGRLDLQLLVVGGAPVAYDMGYIHGGCYYYLKTSFDERYKSLGPATFMRGRLIARLIARGVQRFDFPGDPYEWERQWATVMRRHQSVLLFNRGWRARVLSGVLRLRELSSRRRENAEVEYCDPRASRPSADGTGGSEQLP
jgi:CelD/BcsL family acetyltransferase involved in cellulose biosynthesis